MEPQRVIQYQMELTTQRFLRTAVGATFGWRLVQNPHVRVSVICRSNYERVKEDGLQMETTLWGHGVFRPHRVARTVSDIQDVPYDYVVCANKNVRSNKGAIESAIRPAVGPTTTLFSLQNGINAELPLANAFEQNLVLSAICYLNCWRSGLGLVEQVSQVRPHAFCIGVFNHGSKDSKSEASRVDNLVGLDSKFRAVEDVNTERWTKMIFNGSWNPVAALSGCDTHEILQQPLSLAMVKRLAEEIYEVAIESGAALPRDLPLETISSVAKAHPMVPSMLQDARNGHEMEIGPLCGKTSWQQTSSTAQS